MATKNYDFVNSKNLTLEEVRLTLTKELERAQKDFGFQRVDEINTDGNTLLFGFKTKLGAEINGQLNLSTGTCSCEHPDEALFVEFILGAIDGVLTKIFR